MNLPPFDEPTYYLHGQPAARGSVQTFYSQRGQPQLVASVAGFPEEISVRPPASEGSPLILLRPWRLFPVNGNYDVLEGATGARLGVLHRGGGILNDAEQEIGNLTDPTPAGERISTNMASAVIDAVVSGGEGHGGAHRPNRLHLMAGDELAGVFSRCALPFALHEVTEGFSPMKWLKQNLPAKAGSVLEAIASPQGWRLDFSGTSAARVDARLWLAAVLLRAEIERRFNY